MIRHHLWNGVKSSIERNDIPSVAKYIVGDTESPPRIEVSLTGGDYFEPENLLVDIQIHNYRCTINGITGTISAMFSMPYVVIEDCAIDHRVVHIDHISDEFWESVTLEEIAQFISDDWNNSH